MTYILQKKKMELIFVGDAELLDPLIKLYFYTVQFQMKSD